MCSASCGCNPKKCSNRETAVVVEQSDSRPPLPAPPVAVLVDGDVNLSDDQELANRAAMLLESALGDKPAEINNEVEGSKESRCQTLGIKL